MSKTYSSQILNVTSETDGKGCLINGIRTGYYDVDKLTHGLKPGNFVLVGARPTIGKTSFAECIVDNIARDGHCVLFVCLEMSLERLLDRKVIRYTHKSRYEVDRGQGLEDIVLLAGKVANDPIIYTDDSNMTTDKLLAISYREKMKHGLGVIVVDYLQLLRDDAFLNDETLRITRISNRLKFIARQLGVVVIGISQLSRGLEQRKDKRPMLSDLRQSGSLEQDADIILLMYREGYYDPSCGHDTTEVNIAKNRNGPTGSVNLIFRKDWYQFLNMAKDEPQDRPRPRVMGLDF